MDGQFMQNLELAIIKTNRVLILILKNLLYVLLAILILIVTLNVFCRYVLRNPLFWVTELSCYILVYLIFGGSALAMYRGEHVHINITEMEYLSSIRPFLKIIEILCSYLFIIFLIVFGFSVTLKNMSSYTGSLPIPMGCVYAAAPISGCFMLLLYTERVLKEKKEK